MAVFQWPARASLIPRAYLSSRAALEAQAITATTAAATRQGRAGLESIPGCYTRTASAGRPIRRLEAQSLQRRVDGLEVFPGQLLLRGVAQQVGRVQRGHELDALVAAEVAAQAGDGSAVAQQA